MKRHLVFYDGKCGLCDGIVRFLYQIDRKKRFLFAPLQGETAKKELVSLHEQLKNADSLILIENYQSENEKVYLFGKAALRIFWLLGGFWSVLGVFSFLPSQPFDYIYRYIARNRYRFFQESSCRIPQEKDRDSLRFLP